MRDAHHSPLGKAWKDIGSDRDWLEYGGRWARHIEGTRYHVIRFEKGDGAAGYYCNLHEVDVDNPQLASALLSCGPGDESPDAWDKVAALSHYGAYAPLWHDERANSRALLRAAKRESRRLASDAEAYEALMSRPVNAIGTTARNYSLGIIFASDRPATRRAGR